MSEILRISANTNYDGEDSVDVEVGRKVWAFHPQAFVSALRNLNYFPLGSPCGTPYAELLLGEDEKWVVRISPATLYAGGDNSSVELTVREFANMTKSVLNNPTMIGVREYASSLRK